MSLSVCSQRLVKVCLCHRLCRTCCLQPLSSHSETVLAPSMKSATSAPEVSESFSLPSKLQQRNYSTRRYDGYHNHILKCKSGSRRYVTPCRDPGTAKASCSTSSSGTPEDHFEPSHQSLESRLAGSTTLEMSSLSLPPAESIEELRDRYKRLRKTKKNRFVLRPELAQLVVDKVWPEGTLANEKALIIETSPGPGILTRHLLNSGAPKLLTMEREKPFLPSLGEIASSAQGRLRVMHADFFAMHYHGAKSIQPPVIRIAKVLEGLDPVPWEADIPIKVIGSIPHHNERTHAYIIASQLLERLSSFSYGRVQFNIFMSEGCYNVISQPLGNMFKYRALSALMQMSCDIELLHKEPQVSFRLPTVSGEPNKTNGNDKDLNLCLVRLTPKRDLFTNHQLSQQQAFIFVYFVRQALSKRKQHLVKVIEAWAPGHSDIVHKFGYTNTTRTGDVDPTDLLRIYIAISQLESFNGSWMGEEVAGYASRALELEEGTVDDSEASFGIQY